MPIPVIHLDQESLKKEIVEDLKCPLIVLYSETHKALILKKN